MPDEITTILSSVGISTEAFIVLCILAVVVVGAIVVIITTRPILDIYPYFNPIAKVRARKGRLFTEKQLSEMAEASNVSEVVTYLKGFPDYAKYLDSYSIEKTLDMQLAETYSLISRIAPKAIQDPFKVMAKKVDIDNIKSLLTAKEVGLDIDQTNELLIPMGSLYNDIHSLIDVENVTAIVTGLDGTEYSAALEGALSQYEETQMLLPLEAALDNYYLERLFRATEVPANENTQILFSYIGTQVDIANLKLIIRAKVDGLDYETIGPYIFNQGYQLREWKLKDLMDSSDITAIVSGLEGTKYSDVASEALSQYESSGSVAVFEKALDEYLSEYSDSLSTKKPIGIGPIIGYLSKKEKEIKNLKIITRAKREANFPDSKVVEMLL